MAATDFTAQNDLPTWMRRALRPVDWGGFIVFAFSVLLALPLIRLQGLPRTLDNEHWVYQTANMATALREGRLYPRWAPHALGGYGAPIPHFYPPAAPYTAALLQIFLTGQPSEAVRILYVICLVTCGLPVYALVARRATAAAGVFSALLYTYAPYVAFTTPWLVGDLPGALALVLVPLMMWALERCLSTGHALDAALLSVCTAALLLTDLRFAVVGALCAGALLIWHAARNGPFAILWPTISLLIGLLLAAFFWLPAAAEQQDIRWRLFSESPVNHLLPGDLFRSLQQRDPAELISLPQFTLGPALVIFGCGSLLPIVRRRAHFLSLFYVIGLGCCVGALAGQAWLLGPASLALSIAAGAWGIPRASRRTILQSAFYGLGCTLLVLGALPIWLSPQAPTGTIDTSARGQLQYELQGFGIAGLPTGWALPATLPPETRYNPALIASYSTPQIEKIDPETVPVGVQVGFIDHTTHFDRIQVQSDFGDALTILTAAFPGWNATATSAAVTTDTSTDTGLLRLTFPPGINSDVTISLGTTPLRTVGWIVSGGAAVVAAWLARRRARHDVDYLPDYPLLRGTHFIGLGGLWLASAVTVAAVLLGNAGRLQMPPGGGLSSSTNLRLSTDAGLELIAYRTQLDDSVVELTLYWRALRVQDRNLRTQITLVDPTSGQLLQQTPIRHPGLVPTRRWTTTHYISDHYVMVIPATGIRTPIAARIQLLDCADVCTAESRVNFFDMAGSALGDSVSLPLSS